MADANASAPPPPPPAADAAAAAVGDEEVEEEPEESDDEFVPTTVEGAAEWLKEAASADPLDFDGACVAFTQVLKYFAARKRAAEEADAEAASLAELPTATLYAVALLRRYQKAANAMDASALQALGVSDGAQEPGETEATLAEDLYHSGHFFKVAVDGYARLCALEAADGTDAAAEARATVAAVRARWAALGQDAAAVLGVQLSAAHSGFAEVLHELNNCELAAEHYGLAAGALPAEGYGERAAIAYGNQGLELRTAGDKVAMGAACRKSIDILRTLPQTAAVKKHLECMQEFVDDTLDPETVKAVAKNQVVGSAEGMVIHSGNQETKRKGPVNTLQAKKRRVGPASSPAK